MLPLDLAALATAALPALVVGALGAALVWGLARGWDRTPWPVVGAFGALVLAAHGGVLVGDGIALPLDNLRGHTPFGQLAPTEPHGNPLQGDLLLLVHPSRLAVQRAVEANSWPLWNQNVGGGIPLLADPQAQALEPVEAALAAPPLARWLSAERSAAAAAALGTFLALVFTFHWLRRLGARVWAAVAGAVAHALGGYLQLWSGWPLASTGVWLAASLYALAMADQRGERRDWGLLVASLTALALAGHPETIALAAVTWGAVATVRLARRGSDRWLPARRLGAAAGLALLLAAPALLPFAEALPGTLRWQRTAGADGIGGGGGGGAPAADGPPAASRLLQVVAPQSFGNDRFAHYWGFDNVNEDASGFAGTLPLVAALLAAGLLLAGRGPALPRGETEGFWLALLAVAAAAVAAGGTGRVALVIPLGLAVATAATLERLARGRRGRGRGLPWALLAGAAAGLAALHLAAYRLAADPGDPTTLDVLRRGFLLWHLRFLAGTVVLFAFALLLPRLRGRPGDLLRPLKGAVPVVAAAAVAAELLLVHLPAHPPAPGRLAFPAPPILAHLLDETEGLDGTDPAFGRVAGLGSRVMPPGLATVYGLEDVRPVGPMTPAATAEVLAPVVTGWEGESPVLAAADHPLYDRLAVRWLLAVPGTPCPAGTTLERADDSGTLCRRPLASGALLRVTGTGGATVQTTAALTGGAGTRWSLRLDLAPGPLTLETSLPSVRGWRLLSDRRPTPLVADDGLLAARLPRGTRRVDLLYRPAGFAAGLLAAGLGLGLAVAWLTPVPSAARRGRMGR